MSMQSSSQASKAPRVYSLVADGRRIVHTTFPDESEMVEEYDTKDDCLLSRRTRRKLLFGKESSWEYEVGAPSTLDSGSSASGAVGSNDGSQQPLMMPVAASPFCVMLDTKKAFQWRIRNLPFPASTYSVTIDEVTQEIVVRTTNKKYFKRLAIRSLKDVGLSLDAQLLTWAHQHNTLILTYTKPQKRTGRRQRREKRQRAAACVTTNAVRFHGHTCTGIRRSPGIRKGEYALHCFVHAIPPATRIKSDGVIMAHAPYTACVEL
ncbi:unnamed protein product [Rangifer tarandus platyrhynchus]|uniref:Protein DPCD n=1 Tax=Rangifer tarandus platyrhynchus TaxID=3082113 RepID=A0ABN8XLV9_RANTA|nr:unnamed protein product [Rangifer tarandus platyrhynchus]